MATAHKKSMTSEQAWRAYRIAFADWSEKAQRVQGLRAYDSGIDEALLALERSRSAYNASRDALAQQLLGEPGVLAAIDSDRERVRSLAALRWEVAGKPEGTAEDDWYRAEEIVKQATAA